MQRIVVLRYVTLRCCGGYWFNEMRYLDAFSPIQTPNTFIAQQLGLRSSAVELRKG